MNTPILDLLRARAEGRLSEADARALEVELARRPELRELAETYEEVHALTAGADVAPPPCTVTFEDVERALDAELRAPWRRIAAVAGLALLVGAGGWMLLGDGPDGAANDPRLVLTAIDLDAPEPAPRAPLPTIAASFDPRGEDSVQWVPGLEDGTSLARVASRPLLVYGYYPGCPMCKKLDATVFTDDRVLDLVERYVPVAVDLSSIPESEAMAWVARGYPVLEVWRPDSDQRFQLARSPDPAFFVESMHEGLERADATGEVPQWETVRRLAAAYREARVDQHEGRLAEAERGLREITSGCDSDGFARLAMEALDQLAFGARRHLLEARDLARTDVDGATAGLRTAVERFAGTSWSADLAAALERLEATREFPVLLGAGPEPGS